MRRNIDEKVILVFRIVFAVVLHFCICILLENSTFSGLMVFGNSILILSTGELSHPSAAHDEAYHFCVFFDSISSSSATPREEAHENLALKTVR